MPKVLEKDGFSVVIYLNDHLPSHVHVWKGGAEVRIQLGNADIAPSLMSVEGKISSKDIGKALDLIKDHKEALLKKWREIHG
jgi:Domain of unknown function (DUF4160)